MIGTTLKNRYTIEERIGAGAMGEVYRAQDLQSGDWVAIKRMTAELAADGDYRKRFAREVQALRRLEHPHIVGYVDAFALQGHGYLVTEFFGGGTLSDLIKGRGPLPEGLFKRIALQVLDAVAAAHEAGVIHRDLKPDNVLMSATGEPKIADFGLARAEDMSTLTQTGTMMGTLAYMPPEAFDAYSRTDHRGDIWALGVILFQMLTAHYPFKARSQSAMIAAIINDDPTPLPQYRHHVPAGWGSIIEHCLVKSIHGRYQTVRDLIRDLQADRFTGYQTEDAGVMTEDPFGAWLDEIDPFAELEAEQGTTPIPAMPNPSPRANKLDDYKLRFVQSDAPLHRPEPAPRAKARAIHNLQDLGESSVSSTAANLMIFGGIFQWVGLLSMMISGVVVFAFVMGDADADQMSFIPVLVTAGALAFGVGLLFEMPSASDNNERLTLIALGMLGAFTWLLLFYGALQFSIVVLVGMVCSVGLAVLFFAAK